MKGIREYKVLHIEEYGEGGCCFDCGSTSGYKAPHHIVRRSRIPEHPERDNHRNLIMLCQECHTEYDHYQREEAVKKLIEERNLNELFGLRGDR